MSVIGKYDQIGQFMADVASLQRIIVPYNLSVAAANADVGQGAGRQHRFAARGPVPDPHLCEVSHPGRRGQWLVTPLVSPSWRRWLCPGAPSWTTCRSWETRRPRRPRCARRRCAPAPTACARPVTIADSLAQVRYASCVDSVRAELVKPAVVVKKIKAKSKTRKPPAPPSEELIAAQAQSHLRNRCPGSA